MTRLPHNIERVSDGRRYRYRGYSKDGYAVRLYNEGGITPWAAYDFRQGGNNIGDSPHSKGKYLGRRRTLTLMGAMLETIVIKAEDREMEVPQGYIRIYEDIDALDEIEDDAKRAVIADMILGDYFCG